MRTYKFLYFIGIIIILILGVVLYGWRNSSKTETITFIVKIKDEIQIVKGKQSPPKSLKFPIDYFQKHNSIKDKYVDVTTELNIDTIEFFNALTNPSLAEAGLSKFPFIPFIGASIIKIDSITPLFSNYDDAYQVMKVASNNHKEKYLFTNLFNYIKIEVKVNKIGKDIIQSILKSFLFSQIPSTLLRKQNIVEYFYIAGDVSTSECGERTETSNNAFKKDMVINSISTWGDGTGVSIIDYDEGVHKHPSTRWSRTELSTPDSYHGDKVMGVLFGGCDSLGLVPPNATAEVVSHINPSVSSTKSQYPQFLHALCKSIAASGRPESKIILIEVHNIVAGKSRTVLPLESDPAMFFLIRLGAFGLNRIIVEAAGNQKINLDSLTGDFYKSSAWGNVQREFQTSVSKMGISSSPKSIPQRLTITNSTIDEQVADSGFIYSSISTIPTTNWLNVWKARPSGAIFIAGYEKTASGEFNCITNYGSKVKIISCGRNVYSFKFDFITTPHRCKEANFNCSSAASAIMTGVIASALSKDTSKTEGDIKRALYEHPSLINITLSRTINSMKVPNVVNFYNSLGLRTTATAP